MDLNLRAVAEFVRLADTETLLDRATVYRDEMEPAALDLIAHELARRDVTDADIKAHAAEREAAGMLRPNGVVVRCERCERPAVTQVWGWHRLAGRLPLFPRRFSLCGEHETGG